MSDAAGKHVFISYVKEDTAEVDKLCRLLQQAEIPYWRDRKDLEVGDAWRRKISEAIRDDSLIFVACFSENSVAKARSYMNEELNLAVSEFRMRPPGATWLLPVRFSPVALPTYELNGNQTLSDLNYADLFGEGYTAAAIGLISKLSKVMGAASASPTDTAAAIESAEAGDRKVLLRRATKEMVRDPARVIELDGLIKAETRRILETLNDQAEMPLDRDQSFNDDPAGTTVRRALAIANLSEPLCWSMQVAARWATPETLHIWTEALETLVLEGIAPRSGMTNLISLRALPALLVLTTGAVAAHAQGNWGALRELTGVRVEEWNVGKATAILNVVPPYKPFVDQEGVANLLAHLAKGDEGDDIDDLVSRAAKLAKFYTPVEDWLLSRLTPTFEDQFTRRDDFNVAFSKAEIFLGIVSEDEAQSDPDRPWRSSTWYGRATWQDRRRGRSALDELREEFELAGVAWPPLVAGFFGGDEERARARFDSYGESFKRVANTRW
ncbi:TIR domain-containing protein [Curtobacterium sp. RHCKG23]|uniref:TIR domain-containing protein n=1 Tax=Curtobacterium citri TaxID=3055139 RepID=A0ABT7T7W9_9MICO|nr:TIR domain-containing protein [Curtobacterium citri]MDM7885651.1 TIR domain-containing protein [Curtobacterium citri]